MRLEESTINPLHGIFKLLEEFKEIHLTVDSLTDLGNIFKAAGVVAENYSEVIEILLLIEDWYGIWKVNAVDTEYYLIRNTNGENTQ